MHQFNENDHIFICLQLQNTKTIYETAFRNKPALRECIKFHSLHAKLRKHKTARAQSHLMQIA